jgi:plasmid stabilization system protein ParE
MTPYRFTSSALTELTRATLYYEQRENGLGTAFLNEIEATVDRILQHPTAWHQVSSRTRRCRTHRFPFGLIYQIRPDEILITSVMDLRRDPASWKHLL